MPKCIDCMYQGKVEKLPVPFKPFGMAGATVTLVGVDEAELRKMGFGNASDLENFGMRCQAPGGGPTQLPIALMQAIVDQPCDFFAMKNLSGKAPQSENSGQEGQNKRDIIHGLNEPKWWQFWRKKKSEVNSSPIPDPLEEARRLSKAGKIKEACEFYSKAIILGDKEALKEFNVFREAEATYNKANDTVQSNRFSEANSLYDKALELYPEFADAWANKGVALFNMGDMNGAIAALEKGAALGNKAAGENLRQIRNLK